MARYATRPTPLMDIAIAKAERGRGVLMIDLLWCLAMAGGDEVSVAAMPDNVRHSVLSN